MGYLVKDCPLCANIGGAITWADDGSNSGELGLTGSSGFDGITNFILFSAAVTINVADTFETIEIEVKDSYGISVNKEITTVNGTVSVADAENGIDLQDENLRVRALIKTEGCPSGKLLESYIVPLTPKAVISGFAMPNIIKGAGCTAQFVAFYLIKKGTSTKNASDESFQAYTGTNIGTFTGQTFAPGDTLILEVVDDISGTNVLAATAKKLQESESYAIVDTASAHDFTDEEITPASLLAISGGNIVETMTVIPKGNNVTINMGGGTAKIEVGRSMNFGTANGQTLNTSWKINNPDGVEINIIWDFK